MLPAAALPQERASTYKSTHQVEFGLIVLGNKPSEPVTETLSQTAMLRTILAAGLAGLFMENAMHRLRRQSGE